MWNFKSKYALREKCICHVPNLKLASRETKLTSATIEALGAESAEAVMSHWSVRNSR